MSKFLSKYHTVSICNPSMFPKGCPEFNFFLCILPNQSGPLSDVRTPPQCAQFGLGGTCASYLKLAIFALTLLAGLKRKQSRD